MSTTDTNRDMLYRAFGLLTYADATLIASALRIAAEQYRHDGATCDAAGAKSVAEQFARQHDRVRDLADIAQDAADR